MTLISGTEFPCPFLCCTALVPKSHLASLSWWEEAKGPEQRFISEREALPVLGAEQCGASMLNTGSCWQVASQLALPADHNSGSFVFPIQGKASLVF